MTFSPFEILTIVLALGALGLVAAAALFLRRWQAAERLRHKEHRQLVRRVHELEEQVRREIEAGKKAERATADVLLGLTRSLIRREEERAASDQPPR